MQFCFCDYLALHFTHNFLLPTKKVAAEIHTKASIVGFSLFQFSQNKTFENIRRCIDEHRMESRYGPLKLILTWITKRLSSCLFIVCMRYNKTCVLPLISGELMALESKRMCAPTTYRLFVQWPLTVHNKNKTIILNFFIFFFRFSSLTLFPPFPHFLFDYNMHFPRNALLLLLLSFPLSIRFVFRVTINTFYIVSCTYNSISFPVCHIIFEFFISSRFSHFVFRAFDIVYYKY